MANPAWLCACAYALVVGGVGEALPDAPDYLEVVRRYADAMIEHGRDTYGREKSPLFAAALDRRRLGPLEGLALRRVSRASRGEWGVRPGDRVLTGANPMHDQNLYQVLYALTDVTGDRKYAAEADAALAWFFTHCQSPATGLLTWGEHMGWDFRQEGPIRDTHEYARPWVLWDRSFRLAPEACRRFAVGLWHHQIADQRTGRFSRHASWSRHGPAAGREFPRHGGFYIATWAAAYEHTRDPQLTAAIEILVDSFEGRRNSTSGAIPADSTNLDVLWPPSNLSLAIDLWEGAPKVPEPLAAKMRACAAQSDAIFLKLGHDLGPGGAGFLTRGVTSTVAADHRVSGHSPYTDTWSTGYGDYTDAQVAMLCCRRFEQVKLEGYKTLALAAADGYLASDPEASAVVWPGAVGDAILLLLEAHQMTGRAEYLGRADSLGRRAVAMFFADGYPLPKASSGHDHYEAITRPDTLAMALLDLWAAANRPGRNLGMVWPDR